MGLGEWRVHSPDWRVVFRGLVASIKTLCSAPCLLNRAKLIWVCLGLLLSSLGRLSPSLFTVYPSFSSHPERLTVSLKDPLTWTHGCRCTYIPAKDMLTFESNILPVKRLGEKLLQVDRGLHQALFVRLTSSSVCSLCTLPTNISPHHFRSRQSWQYTNLWKILCLLQVCLLKYTPQKDAYVYIVPMKLKVMSYKWMHLSVSTSLSILSSTPDWLPRVMVSAVGQ